MGFDAPKSDWSLNWQCTIDLIGQFQISNCAPKLANQSPVDGAPSGHQWRCSLLFINGPVFNLSSKIEKITKCKIQKIK